MYSPDIRLTKLSTTASFAKKKLHGLAIQKKMMWMVLVLCQLDTGLFSFTRVRQSISLYKRMFGQMVWARLFEAQVRNWQG